MNVIWSTLFDEKYPEPGASESDIDSLVADFVRPISPTEAEELNRTQQNPFGVLDPLHAVWRPFDALSWVLPYGTPPASYLSFLRYSNGGEFRTGERWFQFFGAAGASHGVRATLLGYHIPKYMPHVMPFASDGGGNFYLFDLRNVPIDGEYPIISAHAGYLSWDSDAWLPLAASFEEACAGLVSIDSLKAGGA